MIKYFTIQQNALRFTTGEGFVEVTLAPHLEDQDGISKSFMRLTIEDTGEGMTKGEP